MEVAESNYVADNNLRKWKRLNVTNYMGRHR